MVRHPSRAATTDRRRTAHPPWQIGHAEPVHEPKVQEAGPDEVAFTLTWRHEAEALAGELVAENVSRRVLRLSGKPDLKPLNADGQPLPAETVVTLEFMPPGYVDIAPGERAEAPVSWGGWDGVAASGHFIVTWPGGSTLVAASGPRQPRGSGPATNLSSSWFRLVQAPEA